jgi:indolepyruvate ferredoxin oxidoreductase
VVTIGALIGMAAHLEGKGSTVLDQTGLAQKGGAVTCHLRIAKSPDDIHAVRIAAGEADLVLGCDIVVVNDYWALSKIRAGRSRVVLNSYEAMPGTFTMKPDMQFPAQQIIDAVKTALDGASPELVDATELATALLGDTIAANLFMLGYAWQKGWVPLSHDALMRAVELNAAAIEMNKAAFNWGRMAAHDIVAVRKAAGLPNPHTRAVRFRWRCRFVAPRRTATPTRSTTHRSVPRSTNASRAASPSSPTTRTLRTPQNTARSSTRCAQPNRRKRRASPR